MKALTGDRVGRKTQRVTGVSAVAAGLLLLVASPLYIVPGKPLPLANTAEFVDYIARHNSIAISTKLLDSIYVAGLIVFISGFRRLLEGALAHDDAWIADLVLELA